MTKVPSLFAITAVFINRTAPEIFPEEEVFVRARKIALQIEREKDFKEQREFHIQLSRNRPKFKLLPEEFDLSKNLCESCYKVVAKELIFNGFLIYFCKICYKYGKKIEEHHIQIDQLKQERDQKLRERAEKKKRKLLKVQNWYE